MKVEDQLISGYLDRLEAAAKVLPHDRGRELIADVAEHLAVALDDPDVTTEADRRQVLDRLGEPEEIVRAALEDQPAAPPFSPVPPAKKSSTTKLVVIVVAAVITGIVLLGLLAVSMLLVGSTERAPEPTSISVVPPPVKSPTG
ncbi:hypothetical protein NLX83_08475 [Allokutzneria sp. A3M-2-11 16]|uniref:HAAS signaling domain-containing protein n=1 Tax=Allokutzneria sp. A3M-2-11 16 TaxID=2962043 RepID=UPI0020B7BA86|nr:hypothetical protein [Allokutzneria sp. A3M-2-11 16]MCP3799289.1 hypothetical protein [Allokutzneria sp. A3M-2-11 16]